jgi:hypothetical protein
VESEAQRNTASDTSKKVDFLSASALDARTADGAYVAVHHDDGVYGRTIVRSIVHLLIKKN